MNHKRFYFPSHKRIRVNLEISHKLLFIVSNAVFKQVAPFKTTYKPFTTLQSTQKITFDLYSSHRDRADLVAPELSGILQKNRLKLA